MNKQFEEWLYDQNIDVMGYDISDMFDGLCFSMQYGVYVDFFDSVGIDLDRWVWVAYRTGATRQEAQQEAIKSAFEILEG